MDNSIDTVTNVHHSIKTKNIQIHTQHDSTSSPPPSSPRPSSCLCPTSSLPVTSRVCPCRFHTELPTSGVPSATFFPRWWPSTSPTAFLYRPSPLESPPHFPTLRNCLFYTSPSPRDRTRSRMPSSA